MLGLKDEHINLIKSVFQKHSEIEEVVLYGSRAKGNYRNGSDIDLTMKGKDLTLSIQLKIENELDDLLLPYKIDLSSYNSIENTDLIDHIERVGICFYKKRSASVRKRIDLIRGFAFFFKNWLSQTEKK